MQNENNQIQTFNLNGKEYSLSDLNHKQQYLLQQSIQLQQKKFALSVETEQTDFLIDAYTKTLEESLNEVQNTQEVKGLS